MNTSKNKVFYLTKKGEKTLWDKYYSIQEEYNKTTLAMGVSDSIDSDLRENPEFMELRVKAMYSLPREKQNIYAKLRNVIIIEEMEEYKNFDGETVIMGSIVTLDIDGEEEIYTIVGTEEGDLNNNSMSENAGLSQAILYHKVGDKILFNGMKIVIKKVEKAIF